MTAPARIVWLKDRAHVVEHVHQAEYAAIVSVRKTPASADEVQAWRNAETPSPPVIDQPKARARSK